jgi:predicted nucleotidyltransferase component of viral defense system
VNNIFLHHLPDAKQLFEVIAREKNILPLIVEKDYWLMHVLWGLQQQHYDFSLKGGTSLSKGYGIIDRFSEDVDIQIEPERDLNLKTGKNHDKPIHIKQRHDFFNHLLKRLKISDLVFIRDESFDDIEKMRNAGMRAVYRSYFSVSQDIKEGVLLEVGFDQIMPNLPKMITSWAYDKAVESGVEIIDNRAQCVKCYCPEYTFVEKLQTISTKYRHQQTTGALPINFLRHYYDVYRLLDNERIQNFIGTTAYFAHKEKRFRVMDEKDLTINPAFFIPDKSTRSLYAKEYEKKSSMYYGIQPTFQEILEKIELYLEKL